MSGLVGEFVKGLRGLKVKELAPYVGGYARTNLTPGALYGRAYEHIHLYKKHLDQGSVKPLFDTMGLLFVGAYALAWPTVRDDGDDERWKGRKEEWKGGAHRTMANVFFFLSFDALSSFFLSLLHDLARSSALLSPTLCVGRIAEASLAWREGEKNERKARIWGDKGKARWAAVFLLCFFVLFSPLDRRPCFFFFNPDLLLQLTFALFLSFSNNLTDKQEYAHYKAEQEAKLKGESGGH